MVSTVYFYKSMASAEDHKIIVEICRLEFNYNTLIWTNYCNMPTIMTVFLPKF